jgi:uncharacterized protein YecE (DUF72 family)
MRALVGTSGFSYPAWKGAFYPEDLPQKKMLSFYAAKFSTVEINNTFYRMPSPKLMQGWCDEVPDRFRFAIKAPQQITHRLRLKDAGEAVDALVQAVELLAEKQGPILFQLPPFQKRDVALLTGFLKTLPRRVRAAFEFRHASWFSDDVYAALRDGGAALCVADSEKLETPLVATADWGYVRLRREDYVDKDIKKWAERLRPQPWRETYVYFKHEDEARGPQLAALLHSHLL